MSCEHDLPVRIRAEYIEMPGLGLTASQAARLWNADTARCSAVLEHLVHDGFLWRKDATYRRADSGRRNA